MNKVTNPNVKRSGSYNMNYWWINANPHDDKIIWSWTNNVCFGEMKEWYSQNKTGKGRKFFQR